MSARFSELWRDLWPRPLLMLLTYRFDYLRKSTRIVATEDLAKAHWISQTCAILSKRVLIMVTITSHVFTNIFQTKHISAVKFLVGCKKNMTFLLISKSKKNLKKITHKKRKNQSRADSCNLGIWTEAVFLSQIWRMRNSWRQTIHLQFWNIAKNTI